MDNGVEALVGFVGTHGDVVLRVLDADGEGRIEVADTGTGMPADVVPHIFERFYRADPARSSTTEGVGLGLSLAKWIVERHHGNIDVRSEPGKGTTFTVHIKKN
jgi:signal transduction histidine kinase